MIMARSLASFPSHGEVHHNPVQFLEGLVNSLSRFLIPETVRAVADNYGHHWKILDAVAVKQREVFRTGYDASGVPDGLPAG